MRYRKAIMNDAKGVGNVLFKCYNIKNLKEGAKAFNDEFQKKHYYVVAVENGKVAGIASWIMHGLPKHGLCELDRIAVLSEYRGQGVAKRLFDELMNDAKKFYKKNKSKLRKIYILTHADNKRAQAFYKKLGTKHETTLKSHYYKGVDEYVFSKFFKND